MKAEIEKRRLEVETERQKLELAKTSSENEAVLAINVESEKARLDL